MAFQVSPGVQIREFDLTAIVPAVSTTPAAYVGVFQWGPADQRVLINTEKQLETIFRKPINDPYHATSWLLASNFLSYGGNLQIVRNVKEVDANAVPSNEQDVNALSSPLFPAATTARPTVTESDIQIKNREHYESVTLGSPETYFSNAFVGKYPGVIANGCAIVVYGSGYTNVASTTNDDPNFPSWIRDAFKVFNSNPTTTDQAANLGFSNDEVHVAVIDITGNISGVKYSVIEYFEGLSVAGDAKRPDGTPNYWMSVVNNKSQFVWVGDIESQVTLDAAGHDWGTIFDSVAPGAFKTLNTGETPANVVAFTLEHGNMSGIDGSYTSSDSALSSRILTQYETSFGDADESDVSILIGYNTTIESDINDFVAIAERRKDCIAFVSACYDLSLIGGTRADILDGITEFVDAVSSTSYGAMDSGYKYQYDRFNNVYRYVPLCADSAGCAVRTDTQKDPWWSPAGYDRGRILNVVKLVFNPNKDERDVLYKKNVNPVITSQGFGVILFGDKTLQKKPSAFDRINVRRLFNVLEKSIATAAKFQLFEFNDSFTRSQFKQLVEPFLRDIQGRRGVTSYAVVCDESNNPASIVDSNQFVADIFVAPNRSINFITLNFIATPTGVTFAEYGG